MSSIRINGFHQLPIQQEDGTFKDREFALVGFFTEKGEQYGQISVRRDRLPEGADVGTKLKLVIDAEE